MTGRELQAQILERYGSKARLIQLASRRRAHAAQDDLATLREFEEDPTRLSLSTTVTNIASLSVRDLARLTPERLRILEVLSTRKEAPSLTALAQRLGRDKKNVSEDLRLLRRLGLVSGVRHGKERLARTLGSDIRIVLREVPS